MSCIFPEQHSLVQPPVLPKDTKKQNFLSRFPHRVFEERVSTFLELKDLIPLSKVSRECYTLANRSLFIRDSHRISNLTHALAKNTLFEDFKCFKGYQFALPVSVLRTLRFKQPVSAFQQESERKALSSKEPGVASLPNESVSKVEVEDLKPIVGRKHSLMYTIELNFMDSLKELWKLTKKRKEDIERQRKLNSELPDCSVSFTASSSEWGSDFDLQRSQLDSLEGMKELIQKYGDQYFFIVERFFEDLPKAELDELNGADFKFVFECLLKKNRLKKAVDFANALIRLRTGPYNVLAYENILHSMIIDYYLKRKDLQGAIKALKLISEDFRLDSIMQIRRIMNFALSSNNPQVIAEIIGHYGMLNLDPYDTDLIIFMNRLNKVVDKFEIYKIYNNDLIDQVILKSIKLMHCISQRWMKYKLLESLLIPLLYKESYGNYLPVNKITSLITKNEEIVASERKKHEKLLKSREERAKGMKLEDFQKMEDKRKKENILHRQQQGNLHFEKLCTFCVDLFLKKGNSSLVFEFFKELTDEKKNLYVEKIVELLKKEKNYTQAFDIIRLMPVKQQSEFKKKN